MGEKRDYFFTPKEYLKYGDRLIEAPPLINTSLQQLADASWYLSVYAQWLPTHSHTKIKYHFCDPDKKGNPFLTFRLWHPGRVIPGSLHSADELNQKSYDFIKILRARDLTPNFTRPPAFTLPGLTREAPAKVEVETVAERQMSDLEMLTEMNEKRRASLKKRPRFPVLDDGDNATWASMFAS